MAQKTPQQTANDLVAVLNTFMDKWHVSKVALIGYSFGACVLPFVYNRLPSTLRSHVVLIALLGFAILADFEIQVYDWLGLPSGPEAVPVARIGQNSAGAHGVFLWRKGKRYSLHRRMLKSYVYPAVIISTGTMLRWLIALWMV